MGAFIMRSGNPSLVVSMVMALTGCVALAQGPTYHLGRTPSKEEIRKWDISISPDGHELPPGSGTAKEGARIYKKKCAYCHGPTGAEPFAWYKLPKPYPKDRYSRFPQPLVGGKGTLTGLMPIKSIGNYWAFATTVWDYINRAMPPNKYSKANYKIVLAMKAAGQLRPDEVYAVTAFLLYRNGIIKESDVLDAKSLPKIQMPNRHGFLPDQPGTWYPRRQVEPHIGGKTKR